MRDESKIDKLKNILEILNTDRASTEEVATALKAVLDVVKKVKEELSDKIATNKGEMADECRDMYSKMSEMEKRLSDMHSKLSDKMGVDKSEMKEYCKTEMQKCKDMIPTIPSFAPLEKKIEKKIIIVNTFSDAPSEAQKNDMMIVEGTGEIYIYK